MNYYVMKRRGRSEMCGIQIVDQLGFIYLVLWKGYSYGDSGFLVVGDQKGDFNGWIKYRVLGFVKLFCMIQLW